MNPDERKHMTTPWIHTHNARAFDLISMDPKEIDPVDIAYALARINRFTGHTKFPYSVAQHSCLMADEFTSEPFLRVLMLMHDAHEAYMGDISSPVKMMFPDLQEWEAKLEDVVRRHFGLPRAMPPDVRECDLRMLMTEAYQLMSWPPPRMWSVDVNKYPPYPNVKIYRWEPERAQQEFHSRMVRWGVV